MDQLQINMNELKQYYDNWKNSIQNETK
jgi:hypothetical protein